MYYEQRKRRLRPLVLVLLGCAIACGIVGALLASTPATEPTAVPEPPKQAAAPSEKSVSTRNPIGRLAPSVPQDLSSNAKDVGLDIIIGGEAERRLRPLASSVLELDSEEREISARQRSADLGRLVAAAEAELKAASAVDREVKAGRYRKVLNLVAKFEGEQFVAASSTIDVPRGAYCASASFAVYRSGVIVNGQ